MLIEGEIHCALRESFWTYHYENALGLSRTAVQGSAGLRFVDS